MSWSAHQLVTSGTSWSHLVTPKGAVESSDVCVQVDVLVCAKVLGDGDAVEVLADLAVVDRRDVEKEQEADEEDQDRDQADPHEHDLFPPEKNRVEIVF